MKYIGSLSLKFEGIEIKKEMENFTNELFINEKYNKFTVYVANVPL